jgi:hypothetical protein
MSFTEGLVKSLKEKGLSDSSIILYVKNLTRLNDGEVKNLKFLENVEEVQKKLEKFKPSTRKAYLTCIVSVLGSLPSKKNDKIKTKYYSILNDAVKTMKETPSEQMTKTQSDNWLDWEGVTKVFEDNFKEVESFATNKTLTDAQYTKLLNLMVLSLYILVPPRRNEDYSKMVVKNSVKEGDSTEQNYLDLTKKEFIFNVFKTAKKFKDENKVFQIPDSLFNIILLYLKHHPIIHGKKIPKDAEVPFLVYKDGSRLDKINSITRILNKIFGKKIGVSMLRHSYLTNKFGDVNKEKEEIADAMGHSVITQGQYIKDPTLNEEPKRIFH